MRARLPQRFDLVTDPARCGPLLAGAMAPASAAADWHQLRVSKVLPWKNGDFVVQYEVPFGGGTLHLGGHLVADSRNQPEWSVSADPGVAWLAESGLAVATLDSDPGLKHLPEVLAADWRHSIAENLPWPEGNGAASELSCEVLAYRLAKRCVLRLACESAGDGAAMRTIAKVVRPRKLKGIVAAHVAAGARQAAGESFSIPRILYVDAERGVFVMEEAEGDTLHSMAGRRDLVAAYAATGSLLRAFHKPAAVAENGRTAGVELTQLKTWTELAGGLFADLADDFARCFARVAAEKPDDPTASVVLHRDFYDKQVLVGPDRLTLLDLDTITAGDPALDVGNFLAHVRLRRLQVCQYDENLSAAGRAFLTAYGADAELGSRVRWWQAAALLRLAALYAFRPQWRSLTPTLLEEMDKCLHKSESPT